MSIFVGAVQALLARVGPYFLHNKNVGTFLESLGHLYDDGLESLEQGLDLSNPLVCDSSAFPILSVDRGIRLYPAETSESKRLRLSQWWQLHRGRGTHVGELKHAQPYFLPDIPIIRIVHQDGAAGRATWWTIDGAGAVSIVKKTPSNWNYDAQPTKWSRWWAIIYIPASLIDLWHWDDGNLWDTDGLWDGVTAAVAQDIVNLFLEWHSAHSRLAAVILATDPASFDPTAAAVTDPTGWTSLPVGNWGSPISPPPVSVHTRPPTAVWLYESNP